MMSSFLKLVLARCLNIHVPKCFWLKGWLWHCGQRSSVEVWTGVQRDQRQWWGAVKERQQIPAWVPSSAPALWAAGPKDLQPPPWPLLPFWDQSLPDPAQYTMPHGFRMKREVYSVVHHPPSLLPYSMQWGASLPPSAPHHHLSSLWHGGWTQWAERSCQPLMEMLSLHPSWSCACKTKAAQASGRMPQWQRYRMGSLVCHVSGWNLHLLLWTGEKLAQIRKGNASNHHVVIQMQTRWAWRGRR